jgi:hypothetical protein
MAEELKVVESADHREEVRVSQHGGAEHREHIVENLAAAREHTRYRVSKIFWLLTGLLEVIIGLRVLLKFIAANPAAPFAAFIYSVSDLFLWPFAGLTATPSAGGIVLDIPAIIAMLVYALLAWGIYQIVKLALIRSNTPTISVYDRDS